MFSTFVNAAGRPDVASNVVAYDGQQGVKVWTLRIGPKSENEALVQVEGVDNDWNLKIQKMKVEKTDQDTRYTTTVNGKKFVAMIINSRCCGELYLPNDPQNIDIVYSEELSKEGDAQAFLTNYINQKK